MDETQFTIVFEPAAEDDIDEIMNDYEQRKRSLRR